MKNEGSLPNKARSISLLPVVSPLSLESRALRIMNKTERMTGEVANRM